jgi:hypothetical protein
MRERPVMRTPVSRRTFFVALGGGLAASWTMGFGVAASIPRINKPAVDEAFCKHYAPGYVDYEGWILTPADKQRLRTGEPADCAAVRDAEGWPSGPAD